MVACDVYTHITWFTQDSCSASQLLSLTHATLYLRICFGDGIVLTAAVLV